MIAGTTAVKRRPVKGPLTSSETVHAVHIVKDTGGNETAKTVADLLSDKAIPSAPDRSAGAG